MKQITALICSFMIFFGSGFAAYTPTVSDTTLLNKIYDIVQSFHTNNPSKLEQIGPKFNQVALKFPEDSRERYVLMRIFEYITGLLTSTGDVSVQSPSVIDSPVSAGQSNPTQVVQNTEFSSVSEYLSSLVVKGDPNADFSIIEFSDFLCHNCQKFTLAGTLDNILAHYGSSVNIKVSHTHRPDQTIGAEATECVRELAGNSSFFRLKSELFRKGTPTTESIDSALGYLDLGIDRDQFDSCLSTGKYKGLVQNQMAYGVKTFNISVTPTIVFYNNTTGQRKAIPGGNTAEDIITVIDQLEPTLVK